MAAIDPHAPVTFADGLEIGADGIARKGGRVARPTDVPVRDDLPIGHPFRGKRVLSAVLAGMPDSTIDAKGRVVPVDAKGAPVDVDAPGLTIAAERIP